MIAVTQGTDAAFMATELLRAIEKDEAITRTFAQDVESIAYVFLYSLYRHAVEDPQASDDLRSKLLDEFTEFFPVTNVEALLKNRGQKFSVGADDSVEHLLDYYLLGDDALGLCAAMTFNFLKNLNQTNTTQGKTRNPVTKRATEILPVPEGMPFAEVYPLWIKGMLTAALELPGAQDGGRDEEEHEGERTSGFPA